MNLNRSGSRRLSRALTAVAVSAVAAILLAACSTTAKPAATASVSSAPTQTLTLASSTAPVSLDPAHANADSVGSWYNQLSYDPLIRLAPDGTFKPDLATSWKFLDKGSKEFQLTIRKGVTFSDGTALTAAAVVKSLKYYLANATNGQAWLGGADTTVQATGTYTVVLHLGTANSTLPGYLTQRTLLGSVINPKGISDPEAMKSATFGAGPYVLDTAATIPSSSYVFVPNKKYWNPSSIHYAKVVIQVSASNAASLQAIESGEADIMRGDLSTATSAKAAGLKVVTAPTSLFGVDFVDRDGSVVPALKDVRVRQALAYAIDRKAITNAAWGADGKSGSALTLPDYVGFTNALSNAYAYNPTKAKQLLAEAGYAKGLSFTIGAWNLSPADVATQAIVQDWKAVGVNVTIAFYSDAGALATDVLAKKFGVITYYYGAGRTSSMMNDFLSGTATQYNPFGSTNSTIATALATANTSPSTPEQQTAFAKAMTTGIIDNAWLTNIAYAPSFIITDDKVANTEFSSSLSAPDIAQLVTPSSK